MTKTKAFFDLPEVRGILKPTLILVRHGSTSYNEGDTRVRGWSDPPLSPLGAKQARAAGDILRYLPIRALYTSDLRRAVQTADEIYPKIRSQNLRIEKRHMLRPWNLGSWEGQVLTDKLHRKIIELETENPTTAPPGGEAFVTFWHRWHGAFQALLLEATKNPSDGFIVVVTHQRNIRALAAWISGGGSNGGLDMKVLTSYSIRPGDAVVIQPSPRSRSGWKIRPQLIARVT